MRGVTAGEDQAQPVLRHDVLLVGDELEMARDLVLLLDETRTPPQAIDPLVARRADEPRDRVRRHSFRRPLLERRRAGLLQRLLGDVEVVEEANQRRDDPPVLGAKDLLDAHGRPTGA